MQLDACGPLTEVALVPQAARLSLRPPKPGSDSEMAPQFIVILEMDSEIAIAGQEID